MSKRISLFSLFMLCSVTSSLLSEVIDVDVLEIVHPDGTRTYQESTSYGANIAAVCAGAAAGAGVYLLAKHLMQPEVALTVFKHGVYHQETQQFLMWDDIADISVDTSRTDVGEQSVVRCSDAQGNVLLELSEHETALTSSELNSLMWMHKQGTVNYRGLNSNTTEHDQSRVVTTVFRTRRGEYAQLGAPGVGALAALLVGFIVKKGINLSPKVLQICAEGINTGSEMIYWENIRTIRTSGWDMDKPTLEVVLRDKKSKAFRLKKLLVCPGQISEAFLRFTRARLLERMLEVESVLNWGILTKDETRIEWAKCKRVSVNCAEIDGVKKNFVKIKCSDARTVDGYYVVDADSLAELLELTNDDEEDDLLARIKAEVLTRIREAQA